MSLRAAPRPGSLGRAGVGGLALPECARSERHAAERGKRLKKLTDWAGQLLLLVGRWHPRHEIVAVADSTYVSLKFLDRCAGCPIRSALSCACASMRRFTSWRRYANRGR